MQVSTSTGSGRAESTKGVAVFPMGQMALFAMVIVLFFLWGMSNNLTDILVQQFKKSFELSKFSAQLVSTANFTGYACMAIPAALVMRRWGYKAGMVSGLCLFGVGLLMFWPAAVSGKYSLFLVALFAVGCSLAILETAANPFVAQFGPGSDERAAAELCAVVQSSGHDSGGAGREDIHPFRRGADPGAGSCAEGRGNLRGISAWRDHACCADVRRSGLGRAAVCLCVIANAFSEDPERA